MAAKLAEVVPPGRPHPPQAMLLAAIALAYDAEAERRERVALERRTRDLLQRALTRIDEALEPLEHVEGAEQEVSRETGDAPGAPILG